MANSKGRLVIRLAAWSRVPRCNPGRPCHDLGYALAILFAEVGNVQARGFED